ncbi:type II toxin-antitoxin system death-on-curing family toxin [Pseudomonas aeruginosa]|uniref:type II toxin-antitoxin system death-on-curing family toxin n=1 Tax=Pseudomonas aeruginosa group TaxID=136841 RepID=UPI000689869A|nr:type II toxin-antitoxin system death-on-curing family toxin [Pseudomonas aeruginosa]KSR66570.1 N-acetylglucosamine-6-phosphate deacetylase [Pseudomonas aeruginosa]MBI8728504.1 type II toxin-antitoxin system death-on-curing family toxin [Pseudomonas aeruginosa]MBX6696498.1 type II toxin-antitoxin system death-on-curing family toxin [Pseudomonas aeruginosa]MBX6786790.1 type II toxin-antitoxin system death-on-curing family toxin [Pseudomonas aeruginosa]MBY9744164.1 type II toxin-antitoxin syst
MTGRDLSQFGEICEGIRYLTVDALVWINRQLIISQTPAEMVGVLKPNELESSQQRPAQYRCYVQDQDMYCLASVLMESLVRNHPFANANKRTAAVAGFIFLLMNGYELTAPGHELVTILAGLSTGVYEREDVENWLAHWGRAYDSRNLNAPDAWLEMYAATLSVVAGE